MSASLLARFKELWSKPACEQHRIEMTSKWIPQFSNQHLVDCVLWWTEHARKTAVDVESFRQIMALIVDAWPEKKLGQLREHIRGERQVIDHLTIHPMDRTERTRLEQISSWLIKLLLMDPLRT